MILNNTFSQSYMWVKKFGGTGNVYVYKILEDNERNIYVYGYFNGQLIFENTTLLATGTTQDIFLAKLSKNGSLLWIKQITGPGTESAYEILLSPDNNYVFITGTFNGNITIENLNIYNTGGNDIFLIKLNKNGTIIWGKNIVYGNNHQLGGFFSVDDLGNFYVTGTFFDLCTFYPGTITLNYNVSYPNRQNFVAKFSPDGEIIWAKKLESDNINTLIKNIIYYNDNLIISGIGMGKIYYDGTFISELSNTYRTGFFIKLNSNGVYSFTRRIFSNNNDVYVTKHAIDDDGYIYLAFKYRGNYFYLDSTATQQTVLRYYNVNASYYDIGLAKYDLSGLLRNAKTYGSSQDEDVKSIDYSNKRVIITGSYKAQINFDGNILNNNGLEDAYAIILNENFNILYALGAGGDKIDWGNSAYFSSTSRYYIWAGDFASASINFGNITLTNDNPPTLKDGFIAKYGCFDTLFATINNVTCPVVVTMVVLQ